MQGIVDMICPPPVNIEEVGGLMIEWRDAAVNVKEAVDSVGDVFKQASETQCVDVRTTLRFLKDETAIMKRIKGRVDEIHDIAEGRPKPCFRARILFRSLVQGAMEFGSLLSLFLIQYQEEGEQSDIQQKLALFLFVGAQVISKINDVFAIQALREEKAKKDLEALMRQTQFITNAEAMTSVLEAYSRAQELREGDAEFERCVDQCKDVPKCFTSRQFRVRDVLDRICIEQERKRRQMLAEFQEEPENQSGRLAGSPQGSTRGILFEDEVSAHVPTSPGCIDGRYAERVRTSPNIESQVDMVFGGEGLRQRSRGPNISLQVGRRASESSIRADEMADMMGVPYFLTALRTKPVTDTLPRATTSERSDSPRCPLEELHSADPVRYVRERRESLCFSQARKASTDLSSPKTVPLQVVQRVLSACTTSLDSQAVGFGARSRMASENPNRKTIDTPDRSGSYPAAAAPKGPSFRPAHSCGGSSDRSSLEVSCSEPEPGQVSSGSKEVSGPASRQRTPLVSPKAEGVGSDGADTGPANKPPSFAVSVSGVDTQMTACDPGI